MKHTTLWVLFWGSMAIVTYDWYSLGGLAFSGISLMNSFNLLMAYWGFVMFSFMFPLSTRHPVIEKQIGLDKMLRYHRILGVWTALFLLLHPVFFLVYRFMVFGGIRLFWPVYVGTAGIIFLLLIVGTAYYYKKMNLGYEIWNRIHFGSYLLYFFLLSHVFFHADYGTPSWYLWIVLSLAVGFLACYRLLVFFRIHARPWRVEKIVRENAEVTTLYFSGRKMAFLPGQFMFVRIPGIHSPLDKNPFTISTDPLYPDPGITAKNLGDFTSRLGTLQPGEPVYLDGPYGVFSYLRYQNENLVMIAGGIGITPFLSMLGYMQKTGDTKRRVTLFWGNKSEADLISLEKLQEMEKTFPDFRMVLVMSAQEDWQGEKGFIREELIEKYVPDFLNALYMICGPVVMKNTLEQRLKAAGVPANRIVFESFDF